MYAPPPLVGAALEAPLHRTVTIHGARDFIRPRAGGRRRTVRNWWPRSNADEPRGARPRSYALPRGFTHIAATFYRTATEAVPYWQVPTRGDRRHEDRGRSFRLTLLNRAFTPGGFSPQLVAIYEERESDDQLSSYRRTCGELRRVRQF